MVVKVPDSSQTSRVVHLLAPGGVGVLCQVVGAHEVAGRHDWIWNRENFEREYAAGRGCQTCVEILHS